MLSFLVLLVLYVSSSAYQVPAGIEKFNNNVIKNGTSYYALSVYGKALLEIQNGTSLTSWPGYGVSVLSKANAPSWISIAAFQSVDINVIDDGAVRVYFSASTGTKYALGVLFSSVISPVPREYLTVNTPLLKFPNYDCYEPRLIIVSDRLLLSFSLLNNQQTTLSGVYLTADGLATESAAVTILEPHLLWEGKQITNHWGFEKNGYIYILYETEGGMGVARSKSDAPLGLFEKMTEPLIPATKSVPARHVLQNTLQWNTNGWPSVDL